MSESGEERMSASRFWDTIWRTALIMVVAVIFTRLLDLPIWMTIVAVAGGVIVIVHAYIMIRRLNRENSEGRENQ